MRHVVSDYTTCYEIPWGWANAEKRGLRSMQCKRPFWALSLLFLGTAHLLAADPVRGQTAPISNLFDSADAQVSAELAAIAAQLFLSEEEVATEDGTSEDREVKDGAAEDASEQEAAAAAPRRLQVAARSAFPFAPAAEPAAADRQLALGLPDPGDPAGGFLSEVRAGLLYHDVGIVSASTEEGADVNFEVLFAAPAFLEILFSPRPHLGASINTAGDTSQVYGGLTWGLDLWSGLFFEVALGGSVHDGELDADKSDRNDLGCRILFREALELGWRFAEHHSISIMADHISNAGLCSDNDGQDTAGLRYGYKF